MLVLREWNEEFQFYTGRAILRKIRYIMQGEFGLPKDICVMGIYKPYKFQQTSVCSTEGKEQSQ